MIFLTFEEAVDDHQEHFGDGDGGHLRGNVVRRREVERVAQCSQDGNAFRPSESEEEVR